MASLGNLFFEILYKDDPKQLEEIKKRALERLKDIEVKVNAKSTGNSTRNKATKEELGYIETLIQRTKELEQQYRGLSKGADATPVIQEFSAVKRELDDMGKNLVSASKKQDLAEGSILAYRAQLSKLIYEYDRLSQAEREAAAGQGLLEKIQRTTVELKGAEEASMRYQRNVGNYKSGFNGLQFQLQQLARELPSMAYGMNIFFGAISNNLPMFADEVKRARDEYNKLRAEQAAGMNLNVKAVPVWKQLITSLFSWQTAIIAAVTLLTLYGGKLVDMIFKTKSATKAHDAFVKSLRDGNSEYGNAIKDVAKLEGILGNVDGKFITAKDAIDEYNKSIGANIGETDDLNTAIQTLLDKKQEYLNVMFQMAMANSFLAEMQKKASEAAAERQNTDVKWMDKAGEWLRQYSEFAFRPKAFINAMKDGKIASIFGADDEFVLGKREQRAKKAEEEAIELGKSYREALNKGYEMAKKAGIDMLPGGEDEKDEISKSNDPLKERVSLLMEANSLYREWARIVGADKAKVVASAIFPDFNPDTLRAELERIRKTGSKEARIEAAKALTGLDKESIETTLKDAEKQITETVAKWDLFSKLMKESGDVNFSMNAAFGRKIGFKSVLEQLQKEIEAEIKDNRFGLSFDEVIKGGSDRAGGLFGGKTSALVKAYQDESKKLSDESLMRAANLLSTFKNYEQQRKDIIAQGEKDIADLIANGASQEAVDEAAKRMNESLASLEFKEFKDSELWAKAFEDAGRLSSLTMNNIITKLEEFKRTTGRNLPINEFKELMAVLKRLRDENESRDPFSSLADGLRKFAKAAKDAKNATTDIEKQNAADDTQDASIQISNSLNEIDKFAQTTMQTWQALGKMAETFGAGEEVTDSIDSAMEILGGVTSIGKGVAGLMSGNPLMMAQGAAEVVKGISQTLSGIVNIHDKKLDRAIKNSEAEVRKLQSAYNAIEKALGRALGNQMQLVQEQKKNLQLQLKQLEIQKKSEEAKKKSDKDKLADYEDQIKETEEQIRYFSEDAAKDLLSIDLKQWASQLGDSLFDAWKKGEDGAEAFRKTAGELLGQVMNDILKMQILQPMMEDVRKALYGTNGSSGYLGADGVLDEKEMQGLADILMKGEKKSEAYYEALDRLNEYMDKNYGVSLKDKDAKGGLSAGIKGITEDTASLLSSYINGMRADLANQLSLVRKYIENDVPEMTSISKAQLIQLQNIARHTERAATLAGELVDFFNSVSAGTKSLKIK
ncbi:hypothetical protein [Petrimonas sulfuriphila]|uniref:hypothetical protein n=1 Tax=Petrimonas sulfuriphila TaxID=285070 RepID=UPI003EBB3909